MMPLDYKITILLSEENSHRLVGFRTPEMSICLNPDDQGKSQSPWMVNFLPLAVLTVLQHRI